MTRERDRWRIRAGTIDDVPFLRAMLYEAALWDPARARPDLDEVLADPHLARYIDGWGRPGDAVVIAVDARSAAVGAAWYRLFNAAAPGYGFIDAATPELSIGVVPEHRGEGAGSALLAALIAHARADRFPALSLSVEPSNPAARLYARHGFTTFGTNGGAWTMHLRVTRLSGAEGRRSP
jgi:ribosomal protein S18 acetylase RimI-like enzyme